MSFSHGSTSAKSVSGGAFQELWYSSSTSYNKQQCLPISSSGVDGGDIMLAQAYHTTLHPGPAAGLYSNDGSSPTNLNSSQDKVGSSFQSESTRGGTADERLSPSPRKSRSTFASPRPAGTGRCWNKLQQGLGSSGAVTELTEGQEEAAEVAEGTACIRSEDAGWRLPYVPAGSIASGGLLSFPSTPQDSPRSHTVFASISTRPSMVLSAGCQ
jgi:hypothetical protein